MWNFIILGLLLGVLGAANMIVAKKPEAKAFIDKLAPVQGIIGIVGLVLGILWFIQVIGIIMAMVTCGLIAALGLIFGLDLIKSLTGSDALDAVAAKLVPFKGIMGLVLIGLSIYAMLATLIGLPYF